MSNATSALLTEAVGSGGITVFDLPVKGSTTIYKGTLVAQITASGYVVPYSTASTGPAIGIATHTVDNSAGADGAKRVQIESRRMYCFTNGTSTDAFSEASLIGAVVYATDDHTVADNSNTQASTPVGFFYGMESDGKVRVFIDPPLARLVLVLQTLTDAPASADALRETIVAAFG